MMQMIIYLKMEKEFGLMEKELKNQTLTAQDALFHQQLQRILQKDMIWKIQ